MSPLKHSDLSNHPPTKERRPDPLGSAPGDSFSKDPDPTLEIRMLIEQLQQTARDARAQIRVIEQERDDFGRHLEEALRTIDDLRINERELRSHCGDIASITEQRDAAAMDSERQTRAAREAAERLSSAARERNDAQRQRDEAARQRDEALRNVEGLNRIFEENKAQAIEASRQLAALRQVRDAAHAQNQELNAKLLRRDDEIAEFEYQRDAARKTLTQAQAEAAEYRRQLDAVTSDRDVTAQQVEQLTAELDEQRRKLLDRAESESAVHEVTDDRGPALAEARAQVAHLTVERDAARLRAQEHSRELEEIRAHFQSFRDEEAKAVCADLAQTHEKLAALEAQSRESRHHARNLQQKLVAFQEQMGALQERADDALLQKTAAQARLDTIAVEHDAALTSLNAAQKQIEYLTRDRDGVRQQAASGSLELEAQLTALRTQVSLLGEGQVSNRMRDEELRQMTSRFEKQRVETIDLATQLQTAHREIRELSATLAEARLQAKFATAAARAAKSNPEKAAEIASLASEAVSESRDAAAAARLRPLPLGDEPLTEHEAKGALGAMRHCFQSFARNSTDLSLLNELYCHAHSFAERARSSDLVALHRLCRAFANLAQMLYEVPAQINSSTLRTVNQTIDFLASLMREKNLGQLKDPAQARIYVVDDDPATCHCIGMTMEEQTMQTSSAADAKEALRDLASRRYDLIFLDVSLPNIDGFELCKEIRALALHSHTPVVFLTGLDTTENRAQSTLSGGNDFIAKPFNIHELSVKALTLILKAQL